MQLHNYPDTAPGLGDGNRILSAVGGSLLIYYVAQKHKLDSLLLLGGAYLLYRGISGHCPVSEAWRTDNRPAHSSNINIRTQVVVNKPRGEVYAFWRCLENWPLFMRHLENVDEIDNVTSIWTMKMPGVGDIRWEAKIVKEEKDTELSWASVPGAPIHVTGKINFSSTPGNATRIDVMLSYHAPLGAIGERLARLLTPAFREKIEADIHHFKRYIEDAGKSIPL
ncbi:SRPBCC family protein [Puia dinghuensis]|uniref:Coenzyme Q-binding protein COQ10 START domain-containing protein n=1 Tax=Puia dinghuensis TaxID=1792502 RepID=A0A8J2XTH0_9BACT|nr:SRPBCC family protein [Puia dinghuensis]GGA99225.1 hypothetical protein GCM10011511_23170 [Puia dinghuensis]